MIKQQSNGYVQQQNSMASMTPEPEPLPPEMVPEDLQINNTAVPNGGFEASLVIKPKGPPLFKLSALYKSRLKFCIFLHFVLFLVMLAKLSEDILDRMDIFILELEELFIPKPMPWEWLWTAGILFAMQGLRGLSRNRLSSLNHYAAGTVTLGVCPLIGAAIWFYKDVAEYAEKKNEAQVEKWQGLPVGVWWYGFITISLQVHLYSLYFAWKLIKIWRVKMKRA